MGGVELCKALYMYEHHAVGYTLGLWVQTQKQCV